MYNQRHPSLSQTSRREIIEQFWGVGIFNTGRDHVFRDDSYVEYLETQCRLARQYDHPEYRLCTQENICDIVRQIKAGEDRSTIKASLTPKLDESSKNNDRHIDCAIDLAVRLWLMVHTGVQRGITGQTALLWREGSLKECVAAHFQHQRILTDRVKFEKTFNARSVECMTDVSIRWTPNLVDHLRFIEDGKKPVLHIFHHAAFLHCHRER